MNRKCSAPGIGRAILAQRPEPCHLEALTAPTIAFRPEFERAREIDQINDPLVEQTYSTHQALETEKGYKMAADLVVELLCRMQADMSEIKADVGEIKYRFTSLEHQVASIHTGMALVHGQIDRLSDRVERIEHRLEISSDSN